MGMTSRVPTPVTLAESLAAPPAFTRIAKFHLTLPPAVLKLPDSGDADSPD
jgi:hypothetical protein